MDTVFITGINRGLGLEFARQYAADGWRVAGTARTPQSKAALLAEVPGAEVFVADVRDPQSLRRAAAEFGAPVDLLICNAGIYEPRDSNFQQIDYVAWADIMAVNVLGAAASVQSFASLVEKSRRRQIVTISSRAGSIASVEGRELLYGASKAALNFVSRDMAKMLAERGISVVAVSPGWVRTDMGTNAAHYDPPEAIGRLKTLFARIGLGDSGRFLNFDGEEISW